MAAALGSAAGCGEPSVDVVAVWVDGRSDDDGNLRVRIYNAGERDQLPAFPDERYSAPDQIQIGVDPRARGIAAGGRDETTWVELGSGRQVILTAASVGSQQIVADTFHFTRSGDAIVRGLDGDPALPPMMALASLSGPSALGTWTIGPGRASSQLWSVHGASDAPVIFFAEIATNESRIDGEIQAWAYPSTLGEGPVVDDVRPLGRGFLNGRAASGDFIAYLTGTGCTQHMCVAPSGRVVFAMAGGGACDLLRWSWVEAESTGADTPEERIPLACPGDEPAQLTIALDDNWVVLDDTRRIYLVDLETGTITSHPKPAGILIAHPVARGRALLVTSADGEVMRVDVDGPRMITGIQSPCNFVDGLVVSPEGNWVVQSCNGSSDLNGLAGKIRRISVLDTEIYTGIPMRPIAVDDEGNALLYSISADDDDGVPRGLFVLTADGQLTRIDSLEPAPGLVRLFHRGAVGPGRFDAAGPP